VRDACSGIVRRDPKAWERLPEIVGRSDERCARALLEGIGKTRDPRTLGVLYQVGRRSASLATICVPLAAQCGPSSDASVEREFQNWIVAELANASPNYAR